MGIGAYKDQLDRGVHQVATRWMRRKMGEDNQSSDHELEGDKAEEEFKEEETEDEYKGRRSSQFIDAHWEKKRGRYKTGSKSRNTSTGGNTYHSSVEGSTKI
jgi:hypothetical protein